MLLGMGVKLKDLYKGNVQIWKAQYYVSLVISFIHKKKIVLTFTELGPRQSSSSAWFCLQTELEKGIRFAALKQDTPLLFGLKGMLFFKFKYLCYMVIVLLLCPTVYLCVWSAISSMIPLDFQVPG